MTSHFFDAQDHASILKDIIALKGVYGPNFQRPLAIKDDSGCRCKTPAVLVRDASKLSVPLDLEGLQRIHRPKAWIWACTQHAATLAYRLRMSPQLLPATGRKKRPLD